MTIKKKTKVKKKKKTVPKSKRLSRLRKKILKEWSLKVRERDGNRCIYCGIEAGALNKNDKKVILNAHHCLSKSIKDSVLKFDTRNGVTLCPSHHKFSGTDSAHKAPIIFYEWLRNIRPEQYNFVLQNANLRIDLSDEDVLLEILNQIENGSGELDMDILNAIVEAKKKPPVEPRETIFDAL